MSDLDVVACPRCGNGPEGILYDPRPYPESSLFICCECGHEWSDDDGEDATVADVLKGCDGTEHWPLLGIATGDIDDPETLDLEDWVRPLELTDGRVALEVEASDGSCWWYGWQDGALHIMFESETDEWPKPAAGGSLSTDLAHDRFTVRPVLREDTPFVEVDDAE